MFDEEDDMYIQPYQLRLNDIFCEDTYPEVWQVIDFKDIDGYPCVIARCVGYIDPRCKPTRIGEISDWYGAVCLYRLPTNWKVDWSAAAAPAIPNFKVGRSSGRRK